MRVTLAHGAFPDVSDVDVDLCTVGAHPDAFVLTLESATISAPPVVALLQALRRTVMEAHDAKSIDFNLMAAPLGDAGDGGANGRFRACLAVVAALEKDWPAYANPLTGERSDDPSIVERLPCQTVDASQGKGNFIYQSDEALEIAMRGRGAVAALYDFNRVPGARARVAAFLKDRLGFEDAPGAASTALPAAAPRVGATSIFAPARGRTASRASLAY